MSKWKLEISVLTEDYLTSFGKYNYISISIYNQDKKYVGKVYDIGWFDKMRGKTLKDKIIDKVYEIRNDIIKDLYVDVQIYDERAQLQISVDQAIAEIGEDLYI